MAHACTFQRNETEEAQVIGIDLHSRNSGDVFKRQFFSGTAGLPLHTPNLGFAELRA